MLVGNLCILKILETFAIYHIGLQLKELVIFKRYETEAQTAFWDIQDFLILPQNYA